MGDQNVLTDGLSDQGLKRTAVTVDLKQGQASLLRGFHKAEVHSLTEEEVDRIVQRGSTGRLALGYRDARGAFRIQNVACALDLNAALKQHIGKFMDFKCVADGGD